MTLKSCVAGLIGLGSVLVWAVPCVAEQAGALAPPASAVLAFELIDDKHDLDPAKPDEYARALRLTDYARHQLAERGIYRVLDNAPAIGLIEMHSRTQSLLNCNGCEVDIARELDADRIVMGWVHKVSNLILSVNLQVRDAETGRVIWQRSADIRNNTDMSWKRGMDYLLDKLESLDPRYR